MPAAQAAAPPLPSPLKAPPPRPGEGNGKRPAPGDHAAEAGKTVVGGSTSAPR